MAYTKTTWATGDTITADKLNNMEDGIAANDNFLVVKINFVSGAFTSDKTYAEIMEADTAGKIIICKKMGTAPFFMIRGSVNGTLAYYGYAYYNNDGISIDENDTVARYTPAS